MKIRRFLVSPAVVLAALVHAGPLPAAEPDSLPLAVEQLLDGRTADAAAMLRRLSDAGDVDAAERLALWHLYGERLLGPGPWQRDEALRLLARAAAQGSAVAQRLLGTRPDLAAR